MYEFSKCVRPWYTICLVWQKMEATMISDPSAFLQKVMEQTLIKSPNLFETLAAQDEGAREATVIDILSDRLAAMLEAEEPRKSTRDECPERNLSPDMLAWYEELATRNAALAAALGACDCWGQAECTVCHGTGGPGWTLPDKHLFSYFVRPALDVLNRQRASRNGAA